MKDLIDKIISIGVPLPAYSYEAQMFVVGEPQRAILESGEKTTVLVDKCFDTFESACKHTIKIHEQKEFTERLRKA